MAATNDNHEFQVSTTYDQTISEVTTLIMTAKHARCTSGDEQWDLDILKDCSFISFFIWHNIIAPLETVVMGEACAGYGDCDWDEREVISIFIFWCIFIKFSK